MSLIEDVLKYKGTIEWFYCKKYIRYIYTTLEN